MKMMIRSAAAAAKCQQQFLQRSSRHIRTSRGGGPKIVLAPCSITHHPQPSACCGWGAQPMILGEARRYLSAERQFSEESDDDNNNNNKNYEGQQRQEYYGAAQEALPHHGKLEADFFGEPVTFLGVPQSKDKDNNDNDSTITSNAMAALDGCLLGVISKGRTCVGGGDEGGLEAKGSHSVALVWAEALRHAAVWNNHQQPQPQSNDKDSGGKSNAAPIQQPPHRSAPMLAVAAVAPVLVQTGVAYARHLDALLEHAKPGAPGLPVIQMVKLAENAAARRDDPHLHWRERLHLRALNGLLQHQHATALTVYLKILEQCPGDALAMSQAMDLCWVLGDKASALRAAGSVASYWNERRGGFIQPALPGHSLVSSLMALGFAVAGRDEYAEIMAERCMKDGRKVCGALATWAQCHIFDARGRVAEGISALANFDGVSNYEGAGFLFFEARLGGYGGRFSLDREQRGRGKSAALRLYENNFERVLAYSGFAQGQPWQRPLQKAPLAWAERKALDGRNDSTPSFFDRMLGRTTAEQNKELNSELILKQINYPSTDVENFEPVLEDVLTWLPPTPGLLIDTTLLLLRGVLNGTVSINSVRWDHVRNGWKSMLEIQEKHADSGDALTFYPLASVASSLLFPPSQTGGDQIGNGRLAEGLYMMGELLKLGNPMTEDERTTSIREVIADKDPNFWLPVRDDDKRDEWTKIVRHFMAARDGLDFARGGGGGENDGDAHANPALRFQCWDFEGRPILEHALVYAACRSGDTESLCVARSICSQGVSLRQASPEEWWRYSIVLGLLGDETGSEHALENSVNFGGGQGARA